jgi:hypothetical protein
MRRGIGLLILSTLITTGVARADDTNSVGSLVGLDVNTSSADTYLQYHGRLFVKNADNTIAEYRWGGTSCGSRVLTEDQIAMLQRALTSKKMTIEPRTQDGQAIIKCLVGFSLAEKKNLALLP